MRVFNATRETALYANPEYPFDADAAAPVPAIPTEEAKNAYERPIAATNAFAQLYMGKASVTVACKLPRVPRASSVVGIF